jgi:hypothetical protein
MRAPSLTGRAAFIAFLFVATASFWAVGDDRLGKIGADAGIAGAAACIALLQAYRTSMKDVKMISDQKLGSAKAKEKALLNAARILALCLGGVFLLSFVSLQNYFGLPIYNPLVLFVGVSALFMVISREIFSAILTSQKFAEAPTYS